jgi:hypothetical protein
MARRGRTGIVVTLIVLVALAAGAFVAWRWYTTTPQYATLKALQAVSDRDWPAFQQWVDVDRVVGAAADGALPRTSLGSDPAIRTRVLADGKTTLRKRIEQGVPGVPPNVPFPALMASGIVSGGTDSGTGAFVGVHSDHGGRSLTLDLRLEQQATGWRVTEVRNAQDLLRGQL